MLDWKRERDGAVVVVAGVVLAVLADELAGVVAVAREWGPLVAGLGALALAGAVGYRAYGLRRVARTAPRVVVDAWRVDGDSLSIEARNAGEGVATDLTAVVELGDGVAARTPLRPVDDRGTLPPGADGRFECDPVFRGAEGVGGAFSAVVDERTADLAGDPRLVVAVEYADAAGSTTRRRLWAATTTPGETLAATVENSRGAADAEGLPPD